MINNLPLINIMLLMIFAFIYPLIKSRKKIYCTSLFTSVFIFLSSIATLIYISKTGFYNLNVGHPDTFLGIQFFISSSEALIALTFSIIVLMIVFYSITTIEREIPKNRINLFFLLINILYASLLGVVYSNDLFNSYVFIEVSTLSACGLIIVKDKSETILAAIKYLIMSTIGSGLVLMAIAYLYSITGHLNIILSHDVLISNYQNYPNSILIILSLFTLGLGVKSALFPLHGWLPDAHSSAPAPSSALLSSLVIKVYIFMLIKIVYRLFGFSLAKSTIIMDVILLLGSCGMIFGSIMAIKQKELKRMIAYSSIAQIGYIAFGIGLGSIAGLSIAVYHIIGHALTKSSLFLLSGVMIEKNKSKYINDLKGIGREMPFTLVLFTLASFSMVGIPIFPGFISKWYLSLACIELNRISLILIILASSLLNLMYYFPIVINGFFGKENLDGKILKSKEADKATLFPITILIVLMVICGFMSGRILDFIAMSFS
jgi:multicomponent Na+:H+ antiporter subunit D